MQGFSFLGFPSFLLILDPSVATHLGSISIYSREYLRQPELSRAGQEQPNQLSLAADEPAMEACSHSARRAQVHPVMRG
jgi:hypothetical protein